MGNIDRLSGEIIPDPPISWKEIRATERFVKTMNDKERDRLLWLEVVEKPFEADDGTMILKTGVRFRLSKADERSADGLIIEVQDILKTFAVGPEGERTFTGTITVEGEHPGDIWRVRIEGNQAIEEHVTITWPDGTRVM